MKSLKNLKIPNNTKAILFDMDGVLIDSISAIVDCVNYFLERDLNHCNSMTREDLQPFFAYDVPEFCKCVLEYHDKDQKHNLVEKHLKKYIELSNEMRTQGEYKLNKGVIELIEEIKKQDLKFAVVSNTNQEDLLKILKNVGLGHHFGTVVGNDLEMDGKIINKKPAPDAYMLAAKKLGVDTSECVVLEDTIIGARAGKGAGCYVIGVATGGETKENLLQSEFTDCVVNDLT